MSCELESFSLKLRAFLFYGHLKVNRNALNFSEKDSNHLKVKKCQKEIVLSSILQKNNKENYIISAQPHKKGLNENNYGTFLEYKVPYSRE